MFGINYWFRGLMSYGNWIGNVRSLIKKATITLFGFAPRNIMIVFSMMDPGWFLPLSDSDKVALKFSSFTRQDIENAWVGSFP